MNKNDERSAELNTEQKFEEKNKRRQPSLRERYALEVEKIKREIGDLELIRVKLGLSRRKMCMLLLVDPSAWTRWTRNSPPPPHIYKALSWLVSLKEQNPSIIGPADMSLQIEYLQVDTHRKILQLEAQIGQLETALKLSQQAFGALIDSNNKKVTQSPKRKPRRKKRVQKLMVFKKVQRKKKATLRGKSKIRSKK